MKQVGNIGVQIALVIGCAFASTGCGEKSPQKPDVLLISLDSVRADYLTFLDPKITPHLARLAQRGTIFTQAVSGTSWTLPAHLQMFTGMPPVLHGVQESDRRLDPQVPTLPQLLKNAGYNTAGFYTCWYLAAEYGFGAGFDLYQNSMSGGRQLDKALKRALEADGELRTRKRDLKDTMPSDKYINSKVVIDNMGAALENMGSAEPAFLFAHFFDPHFDYIPPPPYDKSFDPDYTGTTTGAQYWSNRAIYDGSKKPPRQIADRDLDHIRALYRGEIAWTDAAIGELLEKLEKRGRLDQTLIIITADHGEEFFEHGERGHRQTLHDEVLRVPLLVVPPGALFGDQRITDGQASLSDLLPTILDYVGEPLPSTAYGQSLRPAVEGKPLVPRPSISSLAMPANHASGKHARVFFDCLRTPEYKITRSWAQIDGDDNPKLLGVEFFDLLLDPGEFSPLRTLDERRVRLAWKELEREMDGVRLAWQAREHTPLSELFTEVEALVGDDLADLGYASGTPEEHELEQRLKRMGNTPLAPARMGKGK